MNKKLMLCTLVTALATGPALAGDHEPAAGRKGLWGFGGGAVAGALLAGPPGLVGGAIVGALIGRGEDLEEENDSVRLALAEREQQLAEARTSRTEAPVQVASRADLPAEPVIRPLREIARGVAAGVEINLYFRTGSEQVEPQYEAQLMRLPAVLGSLPDLDLLLAGHADRIGGNAENRDLSRARVERVAQRLVAAGVAPERLHLDQFGETMPVTQAGDAAAYGFDRRVQLRFVLREAPVDGARVAMTGAVPE